MAREGALTLRAWPWRSGLATAGQQSTIPETALWTAKNVSAGLDGLLQKRPGLKQWGQTLKTSSKFEPFIDSSLPGWVEANDDTAVLSKNVDQGLLRMNAGTAASNETLTLSWDGTAVTDPTLRLLVKVTDVAAYDGSATNADTFHFRIAKNASTGWEFAVWSGGLYYKKAADNQYTLVAGTGNVGAGSWSQLEIQIDADGNTLVYLGETLVDTIATSLLATPSLTRNDSIVELALETQGSAGGDTSQSVNVVTPTWGSSSAQTVSAITDFRASSTTGGALRGVLLCAAGDYIWHDADLLGVWRPLVRKEYSRVTFFPFRRDIGWVTSNGLTRSAVRTWDGRPNSEPETLDEAPPVQFATEHQTRLWAAGDRRHPLRVYYSGDREPNVWFAPDDNNISDRFDTQLKAGYLEVPSRRGDEVTSIFGDYFGNLVVFTVQGVYRVTGAGPQSYSIQSVTQEIGCSAFEGATMVGNDLWFASREGVHTISATDKFGDLISGFVSGPIQDLWGGDITSDTKVSKTFLPQARLRYHPSLGLVYVALPMDSSSIADSIYVYSVVTQEWYGPWTIDSQGLEQVDIADPLVEVMMHGGTSGKLLYTDASYKSDDGTAIETILESPFINGRTLDPALMGTEKSFRRLRIYLLPRGDWDVKLFWKVDSNPYQDADTGKPDQNKDTNVFDRYVLTDDFRLNEDPDGRLSGRHEQGYIEVRLDARGYGLAFKIIQDGDGEDVAIQGYEVDFIPHGYSRD